MTENLWWLALGLLFGLEFLRCMLATRTRRYDLHSSIAELVERGVAVGVASRQLYRSRSTGLWTILDFASGSKGYSEEEFVGRDEAIRRFVEVTDLE